jgi:hypothetical protein
LKPVKDLLIVLLSVGNFLVTICELLVTAGELLATFDEKVTSLSSSPSPSKEIEDRVETVEKDGDRTKVDTLPVVTL